MMTKQMYIKIIRQGMTVHKLFPSHNISPIINLFWRVKKKAISQLYTMFLKQLPYLSKY